MSYHDLVIADIRLGVLQLLQQDPGYSYNERILKNLMHQVMAHEVSSDQLRTQLTWLEEQGLVTSDQIGDMMSAKLTARGNDVASGHAHVPGVARPMP